MDLRFVALKSMSFFFWSREQPIIDSIIDYWWFKTSKAEWHGLEGNNQFIHTTSTNPANHKHRNYQLGNHPFRTLSQSWDSNRTRSCSPNFPSHDENNRNAFLWDKLPCYSDWSCWSIEGTYTWLHPDQILWKHSLPALNLQAHTSKDQ